MKEIGGYFGLENDPTREEYHKNALRFNLARTALEFILLHRKPARLYVPDFSCYTVREACSRAGVQMVLYDLDDMFQPVLPEVGDDECVYITNYFGQLSNDDISTLKVRFRNMIVDNVQAFFRMPVDGVDTIYSCRKYFGVPDGAYLYTDNEKVLYAYANLGFPEAECDLTHIIGRINTTASQYYATSKVHEKLLDSAPPARMTLSTQLMMSNINYDYASQRRAENFRILHSHLGVYNKIDPRENAGLFFYPLFINDGCRLRAYLNSVKIYTPMLWPELKNAENPRTSQLVNDIVYLPIDQRYGESDMEYIAENVIRELLTK